ncbi:32861_t:CDS:1, partial [Racocetra persica]
IEAKTCALTSKISTIEVEVFPRREISIDDAKEFYKFVENLRPNYKKAFEV